MGQDIMARAVVGVDFSLIHKNECRDFKVTRYNEKDGTPYEKDVFKWIHIVNDIEYDKIEKFEDTLENGLKLYYANSGDDPALLGIALPDKWSMVQEIDLEETRKLIKKVKKIIVPHASPDLVKLYAVAYWSY